MPAPPAVKADLTAPARELARQRAAQVMFETYAGLPLLKFPEDLRVYEHIMWAQRVEVVLELGVQGGGSALWFRDRLRALAGYGRITSGRVIGLDIDVSQARTDLPRADPDYESEIELIEGDVTDEATVERIHALMPSGASCLVVEDLAHTYETTSAALRAFCGLVGPDGFFVVEDGIVDIEEMRIHPDWPRGVLAALEDWLRSSQGRDFRRRDDLELYGLTTNFGGYLQRIRLGRD